MTAIHRYFFGELLKTFIVTVTMFTLLFVVIGLVREARDQGLEPVHVWRLIPYILPDALRFTVPAATLLSACMVYGRASNSNEFAAIKSLGIHPLRIFWPVLLLSTLLSLATVALNDAAVSWGHAGVRRVVLESIEDIAYGMLRTQRTYSSAHVSIVVRGVDGRRLLRPTITYRSQGNTFTLTAEEAELRARPDEGLLTFVCRNGELDVADRGRIRFLHDELERSIPIDSSSTAQEEHPSYIALRDIPEQLDRQRWWIEKERNEAAAQASLQLATGDFAALTGSEWKTDDVKIALAVERCHRLETEPQRRWSNGFSCLCFALIGAPLAVRLKNTDYLTSFFLCFLPILIVYYPLLALGVEQAKAGRWPPEMVWLGNVLLPIAGIWQLRRVIRY